MWYAIMTDDVEDSLPLRKQVRSEHLARLHELREQGRLLIAGPFPKIDAEDPGPAGFTGSLIIGEFESLEEARQWAEADPYVRNGVCARVDVRPFRKVLP